MQLQEIILINQKRKEVTKKFSIRIKARAWRYVGLGVEKIPENPEPNQKNSDPKPKISQTEIPEIFRMLSRTDPEISVRDSRLASRYFGNPIPKRKYILLIIIYIYLYIYIIYIILL